MEMLSSSFFMRNSIGDVVKEEIATIVNMYNRVMREEQPNLPDLKEEFESKHMRFKYICENIGDDIYKKMLTSMVKLISKAIKQ